VKEVLVIRADEIRRGAGFWFAFYPLSGAFSAYLPSAVVVVDPAMPSESCSAADDRTLIVVASA
jgi:hypothetical protein